MTASCSGVISGIGFLLLYTLRFHERLKLAVDRLRARAPVNHQGAATLPQFERRRSLRDNHYRRVGDPADVRRVGDPADVRRAGDGADVRRVVDGADVRRVGDPADLRRAGDGADVRRVVDPADVRRAGDGADVRL